MCSHLCSILCLLTIQVGEQSKPEALLALEQARRSLFSGAVRWTRTEAWLPGREFTSVSRYAANGDRIHEERGDQDGWVMYSGTEPLSKYPQLYMVNADGTWSFRESQCLAQLWRPDAEPSEEEWNPLPDPHEMPDIRWIGLHPSSRLCFELGTECLWGSESLLSHAEADEAPRFEWEQTERDGKLEVTRRREGGATMTWLIDPARGWNAERICSRDGRNEIETLCALKQYGEVWFPETVTTVVNGVVRETYVVRAAAFNQPDDPVRFTGTDLGLEPGFSVSPQNYRLGPPYYDHAWDGERMVDPEEWREARRTGKKKPGPTVQARLRGELSPYLTDEQRSEWREHDREMAFRAQQLRPSSEWERYVKEFIERYRLDDEQTQKAMSVLRECQKTGHHYLNRKKSEFYRLQTEIEKAREARDQPELKRLHEEVRTLRKPVNDIFEQQLKARLERLPTRRQRELAEAATSQPSTANAP